MQSGDPQTGAPIESYEHAVEDTDISFAHYYNFQRQHQALDNRTPVEGVKN